MTNKERVLTEHKKQKQDDQLLTTRQDKKNISILEDKQFSVEYIYIYIYIYIYLYI